MRYSTFLATLIVACTISAVPSGIAAQEYFDATGNALKAQMASRSEFLLGYAQGYIQAVSHSLSLSNSTCIPDGVLNQQVYDVVEKYLTNNPAKLHMSQFSIVSAALLEAFPCSGKN
jgi:hypothetical protein